MRGFNYGWIIVAAGFVANLVLMGAFYASYGLFVLPVSEEFQLSRADANTGLVILSLGIALQAPLIGSLLDRVSVRRAMMVGSVIFGAVLAAIALSRNLWLDVALLGAAFPFAVLGACSLAVPVLIVRWFPTHTARALVICQLGFSVGGIVWPPLAALLIEWQGWRTALMVLGIAAGAILCVAGMVMRDWPSAEASESAFDGAERPEARQEPPAAVGKLLRTAQFWTINLSGALVIATSSAFTVSLAPMAHDEGLTLVQAATLISVMSAAGIAGKLVLAAIGDRFDRILILVGIFLAGAVTTAAFLMTDEYVLLLVAVGVTGFFTAGTTPVLNAVIADRFGRASFGTVTGLAQPVQSIAAMVTIRYAGEIFDRTGGYDLLLTSIIAVNLLAAAVMFATRLLPAPLRPHPA